MNDFTSSFWNILIIVIVVGGIFAMGLLLWSNSAVKLKKGEKADVTGHKWDGDLEEYNNPLPRWWMWMFYLTIAFALGYLALYPGIYEGSKKWSAKGQYEDERNKAEAELKPKYDKFLQQDITTVAQNNSEARGMGQRLFLTYCVQCHGSDAKGAKGFPNLTDSEWLHGGDPAKIKETILNGRHGQMPAFGAAFGEEKIKDVANYVRSLSSLPHDSDRAARGKETFSTVCAACHGPEGKGNQGIGAPNLANKQWLYGSSEKTIIETVTNGRDNVMPSWKDFLGEGKVHLLAAYVYGLSSANKGNEQ